MTERKPDADLARPWSELDISIAAGMWKRLVIDPKATGNIRSGAGRAAYVEIGKVLGRSAMAVRCRYRDCGVSFQSRTGRSINGPATPTAERSRLALAAARARQSAAAALLGDPPPGLSALDGHTGMVR